MKALIALLLLTPALVGCLGGGDEALEPGAIDDAADVPSLPEGLEMEGAEIVSYNDTHAVLRWTGVAPPGLEHEAMDPMPQTTLVLPAGPPLAMLATIQLEDPNHDVDLHLIDAEGVLACSATGTPSPNACYEPVPRRNASEQWTLRVISDIVAPPGSAFELDLTIQTNPRAAPPGLSADVPPGCQPERPAVVHGPDGLSVEDAPQPIPIPCYMHTSLDTWEPTLGITEDGTVFAVVDPDAVGVQGAARSTDQGATWDLVAPHVDDTPVQRASLDPYLYVDPVTSRVFLDNMFSAHCSQLGWSDDRGASWEHTVASCTDADHQTIFGGPPAISPTVGYPNVLYSCAANTVGLQGASFTATCTKSLDGGLTWLQTGTPAYVPDPDGTGHEGVPARCDGGLGHGIVDHRGWVYLPKGWCEQPHLAISKDEGASWERFQVSELGMPIDDFDYLDHEASVGVDRDGTIYYAWIARDRMPYLALSHDDGQTWSEPVMIGAPGLTESSLGAMAVGGKGRIAFAYMGTHDSPGEPWTGDYTRAAWHGFLTVSVDAHEEAPTFYTTTVDQPDSWLIQGTCGPTRCSGVGDFIDVQIGPDGTPWATYVDRCLGICQLFGEDAPAGQSELTIGRLWGGPSLWGDDDPNGPYPDEGGEP